MKLKAIVFAGAALLLSRLPAMADEWGAIAVGIYQTSTTGYVSAGVAGGANEAEARRKALSRCREGFSGTCVVKGTFSYGACGYVSVGRSNNDDGVVGWGMADTKESAYDRCLSNSNVYECKPAVGGCTQATDTRTSQRPAPPQAQSPAKRPASRPQASDDDELPD